MIKIKDVTVQLRRGDIARIKADAVVNPANGRMMMGGGLSQWLKEKGGEGIEHEAMKQAPVAVGEAIASKAGKLAVKRVIHAVTVDQNFKTDEHIIRRACASALRCAASLKVESLALPALGCGVGGFPAVGAAKIMAQEILKFGRFERSSLKKIILCLFDEATFQIFEKIVTGYINHVQNDMGLGPYVAVDAIIEFSKGIIIIERSNPPYGWALPGGFVEYGESLEDAVVREVKEETNLKLAEVRQFKVYSDPRRDPRFHTVSTVFVGKGVGRPQFGDDAKGLKLVKYQDLLKLEYAFDHKQVIREYLKQR